MIHRWIGITNKWWQVLVSLNPDHTWVSSGLPIIWLGGQCNNGEWSWRAWQVHCSCSLIRAVLAVIWWMVVPLHPWFFRFNCSLRRPIIISEVCSFSCSFLISLLKSSLSSFSSSFSQTSDNFASPICSLSSAFSRQRLSRAFLLKHRDCHWEWNII